MKRPVAIALAAAALAGCGSSGERPPNQPKLPSALAGQLADRSDKVAVELAAGDECRALDEARGLQQDTLAAINGGRIPSPFQEHLASTVGDLVARISCVPPAKEHGKGKGTHKGKHEGND